ncbi:hypothetical protein ABIC89_000840 [Variovorax boronicumulans]|uniref:hypothetical protein n=1 Tax=Variovorax boronicumulans TaxID=436515 RepID=UPI003395B7B3
MASRENSDKKSVAHGWHPIGVLIGVILVLIAGAYTYLLATFPEPVVYVVAAGGDSQAEKNGAIAAAQNTFRAARAAQWGQIGDTVGGLLNPVLTFFSCIGLLVTIRLSMLALKESRVHASEQQRLEQLSTMIAALTALHQAASFDYEHYRGASGGGAAPAAERARRRQQDVAGLLEIHYKDLHRLSVPGIPIPRSMKPLDDQETPLESMRAMLGRNFFDKWFRS